MKTIASYLHHHHQFLQASSQCLQGKKNHRKREIFTQNVNGTIIAEFSLFKKIEYI